MHNHMVTLKTVKIKIHSFSLKLVISNPASHREETISDISHLPFSVNKVIRVHPEGYFDKRKREHRSS